MLHGLYLWSILLYAQKSNWEKQSVFATAYFYFSMRTVILYSETRFDKGRLLPKVVL